MKNITVYLGSRLPENKIYEEQAKKLGTLIAENGHTLVYGGAKVGTMGVLANAALGANGKVIGIMPNVLSDKEIMHPNLTEGILVTDMHERKKKMMDLGDIFIVMPGGCGTMEEIFEVITWNQIGIHNKPYAFINVDGFYEGIKQYLTNANELGFIQDKDFHRINFFDSVDDLFASDLV